MREILKTPITDRSAWCAADVEEDLSWLYILTEAEQDEVRAAVARVKERGVEEMLLFDEDRALLVHSVKGDWRTPREWN